MCGIVGFTHFKSSLNREKVIKEMALSIQHRGPDAEGFYIDSSVALGHRRLSIIDIKGGDQPLFNEDESICIVFNGEIYNFQELKKKLLIKGHQFKTDVDTEVIIHLYEEYGEKLLAQLNGMFSFALWDKKTETLFLARDRAGQKPLYYGEIEGEFIFASELKAMTKYPRFRKKINQTALHKYLMYEYIPVPHSIYAGINKLPPGHYLIYRHGKSSIKPFWDFKFHDSYINDSSQKEIEQKLDQLLRESVSRRLISDVPLGVFLSGGIDSSSIVAYMADLIPTQDIKTFSIGFEDKTCDESGYAKDIARHFKTTHHEKILSPETLLEILPDITNFLDEPFADASIIPTYLLSRFTRDNVTVALGGDGGDELFMGYPTFQANRLARFYDWMPLMIHKPIEKLVNLIPASMNHLSLDFKLKKFLHGVKAEKSIREQVWLSSFSETEMIDIMTQHSLQDLNRHELLSEASYHYQNNDGEYYLDKLSYFYFKTYLTDQVLVKVDRASMAASLEVRAPFLDVNVMDFVATIPHKYKLKGLTTKYILKKMLEQRVPKHILYRPKQGFAIPVAKWFRSNLKSFMLDTFSEKKIKDEGFFNYSFIEQLLREHLSGKVDHRKRLWTLLMFELWLKKWS